MIILEGPDGAGKSSLANSLQSTFGLKVFHPGGAPDAKKFAQIMGECEEKMRQNYVLDRVSHISEYVYGPITNGRNLMNPILLRQFFDLCLKSCELIIYCKPSNIGQAKHWLEPKAHKSSEHVDKVKANHETIVKSYDAIFNLPGAKILRRENLLLEYDYTSIKSEHKILKAVHEKCQMRGIIC